MGHLAAQPGGATWNGSEPRYYLSNAPEDAPLEPLAYVGGSRWRIETEFETEKGEVGLDEYETRSWGGLASQASPYACWAEHSCWACNRIGGGKDAPHHTISSVPGGA